MSSSRTRILGLDLGTESVGWTLLDLDGIDNPTIVRAGVHRFDAGVEGDFESGRDESRAAARRNARQPRRQIWRRARRRRKILRLLQRHGLLPPGVLASPADIHAYLQSFDCNLRQRHARLADRVDNHMLLYRLRRTALDQRLDPHDFGRILYHLAQRRGFLSNRKAAPRDDEESVVKADIGELRAAMTTAGARTLGEYLAGLDPETERVRRRWTARDMFTQEFDALWNAQQPHHATLLSSTLRKTLAGALFHQRPLKSQHHLLGHCELIPTQRRAPWALLLAQRFRLRQRVNDLSITAPVERPLTPAERDQLADRLEHDGDLTFPKIRKLLKLPRETEFSHEAAGESKLPGNRTNIRLAEVFGDRWWKFSAAEQDQIVEDVLSFEHAEALRRRGERRWGLTPEAAHQLANLHLEPGYARHGRAALTRLMARMADGTPYATARKLDFPEQFAPRPPVDELPPVKDALPDLASPAVSRALTELRRVVNAIIRRYGKPDLIRIELARDLKRARKQRAESWKRNRANERARERAKAAILKEFTGPDPSRADIQKFLLAEECNWECPFTGRQINMRSLFGTNAQFDVEHIWPFSRSLDDSYLNKTLCFHEENRSRKRNSTPREAYGQDADRWSTILDRVRRFRGDSARAKLRRFAATELPDEFAQRELQETRYISRLAARYLASLYGGVSDSDHNQRIQVSTGRVTAHLRNEWQLNAVLGDGDMKSRDDHRHHAVDAIAIALASPAVVHQLAHAAEAAERHNRRLFAPIPLPSSDFLDDVRRVVLGDPADPLSGILVSKRATRKLNGPLHAETNYSGPIPQQPDDVRYVRKALHKLSTTDLKGDAIVDPVVRQLVQQKYADLGGGKPDQVFADPASHPVLHTRNGRDIPIHKVRVRAKAKPWPVASGPRQRWVTGTSGSNHHTVIVACLDKQGNETRWEDHPVSRYEVLSRLRRGLPIIQRDWGPDRKFKFSLLPDDHVLLEHDGAAKLFRVQSISAGDIEFRLHADGRTTDEINKAKQRVRAGGDKLRRLRARKVHVTHLGEVRRAGG